MPDANIKAETANVVADKVVLPPKMAETLTAKNEAAADKVATTLAGSQEKIADTLVESQIKIATDLNDREARAEAREERREVRDWWFKVIFGFLTFVSTMAGIWSARESSIAVIQSKNTSETSKRTEHTVNSRMDDMILRVEKAAFAEGKLKGAEKE